MSDWVSACRELQVEGTKGKARVRTAWNECLKVEMKRLGLSRSKMMLIIEISGRV